MMTPDMSELPKVFDHARVDPKWYAFWESIGAFRADPGSGRPVFSMVLPPPNVTGSLHIGHALNHTLPDILARWKRMRGFDVLWLPGTDHAGIATQNVVERHLKEEGKTRHHLGREAFERRVWEWVEQSHGLITGQMRKLGDSVDWSRERFTLDEDRSRAVRRVFVTLYQEGLIYRERFIVNWCPRCRTALSDLEVAHRETAGSLYHVRYPMASGVGSVTVATTRPETMLGDTAVAVHPDDERYGEMIGQSLRLPVIGRELPIIADPFVDRTFGTGAVKVTPAHDPNDFAMGQRHQLPQVIVIDEDGRMTAEAGPYAGRDRFEARAALVEQLEREALLERVEEHRHAVGHCDRCGTVVEPLVSKQWFVRIQPLAQPAIEAVRDGRIRFVPANWAKTYFEWMEHIHDWCISRQLWWGHRIPAWYCDRCGETIVSEETPDLCPCGGLLRQDPDVLDTWFSSGLWPFSTMGWPEPTADLARYYPTTLLLTAFDIIFFWVARMIMMGLKFTGREPFGTVYFTALVRDAHGQKMSKSKGNVVDPLEVMDRIGADAFRFALAVLASPGMDISLAEGRLSSSRHFINKIWNASRFVLMNVRPGETRRAVPDTADLGLVHRWILHRVSLLARDVDEGLEHYRFDQVADRLFHFFWGEYADWYIEMVKPELQADAPVRDPALAVLLEVHDRVLRLLHPITPFITEEIWQQLPRRADDGSTVTRSSFPEPLPEWVDEEAAATVELLQDVITAIRTLRSERGVRPVHRVRAIITGADERARQILQGQRAYIERLAGLEDLRFEAAVTRAPDVVSRVVREMEVHVSLAGAVDREAEIGRLRKGLDGVLREMAGLERKLGNAAFVDRAPAEVVEQARSRREELAVQQQKLERLLQDILQEQAR
jgi:valyl-tRNA synthetase